jgi:4-hydroxy-2-oxoheptanedioate aldolase
VTATPLARRLRDGEPLIGLIAKLPCAAQIETAGHVGFDFVVLDTEHGPANGLELEHHLRAAAAVDLPALVRTSSGAAGEILAALDAGAVGVVVPHVRDASDARAVVSAAHYPPVGRRGLAVSTRAGRYGATPLDEHLRAAAEQTCVVVQIEDAEAVPRADEILAVEGIDAVLVGTTDLALSYGRPGTPLHPEVEEAVDAILRAAAAAGRAALTVAASTEEAVAWRARGVSGLLAVSTALVHSAFSTAARALQAEEKVRGERVVVLAGMLGDEDFWADVAEALVGCAEVQSARIDLDETVSEMAETVLAGAPPAFALAGHSLGAIVALEIVRRAPGRVTRLALLNASARPPAEAQLAAWAEMRDRTEQGAFDAVVADFAGSCLAAHRRADTALRRRVEAMAATVGAPGLLRQLRAQASRPDGRPSLPSIAVPLLVVSGADDEVCPCALQEELVGAVPGSEHIVLDGVGHMSALEAPAAVAQALAAWLERPLDDGRIRT